MKKIVQKEMYIEVCDICQKEIYYPQATGGRESVTYGGHDAHIKCLFNAVFNPTNVTKKGSDV